MTDETHRTGWEGERDLLTPFVPRRGRGVALGLAAITLTLFGILAVLLPGPDRGGPWEGADRLMFFLVGVALAVGFWRYASIRATPSASGIVVRNLVFTRTLDWSEIVAVQFGGGMPWVTLDLADADTVAVMAIQKADGPSAQDEAQRLAQLVANFGEPPEPQIR